MSHLRHRAVPQLLALKVQYKLPGNGPGPTQALRSSVHLGVTLLVFLFLAMPNSLQHWLGPVGPLPFNADCMKCAHTGHMFCGSVCVCVYYE